MKWSFPFLSGESLLDVENERDGVRDEKNGGTWNDSKKLLPSDFAVCDDVDEDVESRFRLFLSDHNDDGYENSFFGQACLLTLYSFFRNLFFSAK